MSVRRNVGRRLLAVVLLLGGLVAVVPGAQAATEVRLTAAGDYGARAATDSVLRKVAELDPDAHLALGDLAYRDVASEDAWCSYVKERIGEGFPFELISGNHESLDVADGAINDFSACLPNQVPGAAGTYGRQYYMDLPSPTAPLVRVIQVAAGLTFEDGEWVYSQGSERYRWVADAIDQGRANGAKWIVVSTHYPCFSVGSYACQSNTDLYRLLIDKRVDLVLHGHEHGYMRTHQLRQGVTGCTTVPVGTFDPDCVADSDGSFQAGAGTVFATVGTGGTPLRDVNASDSEAGYFAAWSGLNANPTYGLLDIRMTDTTLTAGFVGASGGNFTDSLTITRGVAPPNLPPTAVMSAQTSGLWVDVDGSSSSDSDGTIASWQWAFGDGATASGADPAPYTYAAAGTYTVSLTVTDDDGATATATKSVTVGPPPAGLAVDTFTRSLVSGWGTADLGGVWTVSNSAAFSVNGTNGKVSTPKGSERSARLRGVSTTASDLLMSMALDKVATGGGLYVDAVARSISGAGDYRATLRFRSDGKVAVRLGRTASNGTETQLRAETLVPNGTYTAGERFLVRTQAVGTAPTTLQVRVWKAGTVEPSTWLLTVTDTTTGLQAAGNPGLTTYLSSSATNSPITLSVDDVALTNP